MPVFHPLIKRHYRSSLLDSIPLWTLDKRLAKIANDGWKTHWALVVMGLLMCSLAAGMVLREEFGSVANILLCGVAVYVLLFNPRYGAFKIDRGLFNLCPFMEYHRFGNRTDVGGRDPMHPADSFL